METNMIRKLDIFVSCLLFFSINIYASNIDLTKKEKKYIDNNSFKIITTATWAPFNFYDGNNNLAGLGLDYWELIVSKTGIKSEIVIADNFKDVLNSIKLKTHDMTLTTSYTKQRSEYAIFSKSYDSFPIAIATTKDKKFIAKTSLLYGKKVAVGKEYSAYYLLKEKYPSLDFVQVKNTKEALNLLESEEVYAVVDILPALQYNINNHQSNNLKIAGITDVDFYLQIMINDNQQELVEIINNAIDSISESERNEIYKKWLFQSTIPVLDYTLLYQIAFVFFIIVSIIIYWNRKLSIEKKKLDYILSNLPVPILITDNETRKILFANPYAVELYKFDMEQLIGKSIDIIYTDHINQREDILNAMDENGVLQDFESKYRLKDEEVIDALLSIIPIDYNKKPSRVGVIANITELKNIQKELTKLNQTLEERVEEEVDKNIRKEKMMLHQNRLAQMGEMLNMIAHQWRQPLNNLSVINQTLILKHKIGKLDQDIFEEFSKSSKSQIKQMSQTIDDFSNFFKPDKEKTNFFIHNSVKKAIGILEPIFEKTNIEVELDIQNEYELFSYENEFGQALLNILNNAKDALVENEVKNKKITVVIDKIDQTVSVKIIDNAGGIPEDIIDKIFEPYFSTKSEKNGTGLGLYMTKIIVEDHMDGNIYVQSKSGNSSFNIEFSNI
jgi:PAS domain S-box-containing protein